MRYIKKMPNIPHYLERAHQTPPATPKQAESRWRSFSSEYKRQLSGRLCNEQYGLCAYSEIRPDEEGLGTHLEHVKPKGQFPDETFNYHNIVLCALDSDYDTKNMNRQNVFGGHAKLKNYDQNRFISCLDQNCSQYFTYLSDGRVVPSNTLNNSQKQHAQYTIDLLNLNCQYLKNKRKKWIDETDDLIQKHLTDNEALYNLADLELGTTNGKLRQFHSAVLQRFGALGRQILAENYPELL